MKLAAWVVVAVALLLAAFLFFDARRDSDPSPSLADDQRTPEWGESAEGPVIIVGVDGGHARFGYKFPKVLAWDDGVVLVGPLAGQRWRWCKFAPEWVAQILRALHRAGVSRPPEHIKGFTEYLIVGCRYEGESGIAVLELERGAEDVLIECVSDGNIGTNVPEIQEALAPVLTLIKESGADCSPVESTVFRRVSLAEYASARNLCEKFLDLDLPR